MRLMPLGLLQWWQQLRRLAGGWILEQSIVGKSFLTFEERQLSSSRWTARKPTVAKRANAPSSSGGPHFPPRVGGALSSFQQLLEPRRTLQTPEMRPSQNGHTETGDGATFRYASCLCAARANRRNPIPFAIHALSTQSKWAMLDSVVRRSIDEAADGRAHLRHMATGGGVARAELKDRPKTTAEAQPKNCRCTLPGNFETGAIEAFLREGDLPISAECTNIQPAATIAAY